MAPNSGQTVPKGPRLELRTAKVAIQQYNIIHLPKKTAQMLNTGLQINQIGCNKFNKQFLQGGLWIPALPACPLAVAAAQPSSRGTSARRAAAATAATATRSSSVRPPPAAPPWCLRRTTSSRHRVAAVQWYRWTPPPLPPPLLPPSPDEQTAHSLAPSLRAPPQPLAAIPWAASALAPVS